MEIIALYTTDVHHSTNSKHLIAICDSNIKALNLAQDMAFKTDGEYLDSDQIYNFMSLGQTQGYMGDNIGEFYTEKITLNELI